MASIYRRGNVWWVKFHLKGVRIQQSLNTTHERVAQARKSQIEYRLATGTLVMPSETSVGDFLEGFCQYLRGTRTRKSYKNDISYLRIFFGPVCPSTGEYMQPKQGASQGTPERGRTSAGTSSLRTGESQTKRQHRKQGLDKHRSDVDDNIVSPTTDSLGRPQDLSNFR